MTVELTEKQAAILLTALDMSVKYSQRIEADLAEVLDETTYANGLDSDLLEDAEDETPGIIEVLESVLSESE